MTGIPSRFSTLLLCAILSLPLGSPAAGPPTPADVSLNFRNTDIDLVLQFLSESTGRVFIKSDAVRGFITLNVPGRVPADEAIQILRSVLELKGFTIVKGPGRVMKVVTHNEAVQSDLDVSYGTEISADIHNDRMITHVIPIKYVDARELRTELAALMSKGGALIADERTNALIVTDMASNVRRLLKMIASLDVRTPQVLIEALIMEISLTDETKLGFEWSHAYGFHGDGHDFQAEVGQDFDVPAFVTEGLRYSILRGDGALAGLVQLLATDKNVNILSTPHVMTVNNQPAVIRVGEEVPILTQTRVLEDGDLIRSFDYKSVAVELEVTPRINQDRDVYLKVHPLVKKILGFNSELNAPILATREAQTSVLIRDGETVVIGGLIKDDESQTVSKIPILGDIPIIGLFFRRQSTINEKTELLVFITPRVVTDTRDARALTRDKETASKSPATPSREKARRSFRRGKRLYREERFEESINAFKEAASRSVDEKMRRKAEKGLKKARKRMEREKAE